MAFDFDVKIFKIPNPTGKTLAFANLIIDNQIELNGFKIIEGAHGLFVAPPNRKSNKTDDDGKPVYFDDVRFIGDKPEGVRQTDLQQQIYTLVLKKFEEKTASNARGNAATAQANRPADAVLW